MVDTLHRIPTYTIVDTDTSPTLIYIGKAEVGESKALNVWQVFVVDTANGAEITYADGNAEFDNIWDDRVGLSYS